MQVEFTLKKREKRPWMNFGQQVPCRDGTFNIRVYREFEVVANEPLSKLIHLFVVRATDYLQIIPIGRHVLVQLVDVGEYRFFFLSDNNICSFIVHSLLNDKFEKYKKIDEVILVFLYQSRRCLSFVI